MVTNVTCPSTTRMSLIKTASGTVKSLMTIMAGVLQGKIAMAMGLIGIGATMTVLSQVSTFIDIYSRYPSQNFSNFENDQAEK